MSRSWAEKPLAGNRLLVSRQNVQRSVENANEGSARHWAAARGGKYELLFLLRRGRCRAVRFDEFHRCNRAVGLVFGDLVAHHRALGHQLAVTLVQAHACPSWKYTALGLARICSARSGCTLRWS